LWELDFVQAVQAIFAKMCMVCIIPHCSPISLFSLFPDNFMCLAAMAADNRGLFDLSGREFICGFEKFRKSWSTKLGPNRPIGPLFPKASSGMGF
jgi:hypothetical protein